MKILIAHDGSPCSDAALEGLSRAGLPSEADVLILSVVKVGAFPLEGYRVLDSTVSSNGAGRLQVSVWRRLGTEFPKWRLRAETAPGSPAKVILEKASAWQPHLVVVGTHGRSAPVRAVLGSVSLKLIAEAPCAVRVGRVAIRDSGPIQIVVAADSSPASNAVVDEVRHRSWPAGTVARVVAVFEVIPPTIGELMATQAKELRRLDQTRRDQLSAAVKRYAHVLTAAGLSVSSDVVDGNPRDVLLHEAETLGADAIFVGARALSGAERVLSSVSRAVASHASCTVEVVHVRYEVMQEHANDLNFVTL